MPKQLSKSCSVLKKNCCKNCGSTEHQTKDCLQRPRKFGFKTKKIEETKENEKEVEEMIKETEELTKEIQEIQNKKETKEFLNSTEEEKLISEQLNKKRMAIKNLRRRDDIAPYLKDLKDGNAKVEREIEDMNDMWDDEVDKTKRNDVAFF